MLFLLVSCTYFDNKKVNADDILRDKLREIDITKVDRYPVFEHWESLDGNIEEEKVCFLNTIQEALSNTIIESTIETEELIDEACSVHIVINRDGNLLVKHIDVSDTLIALIPNISELLERSLENLPRIEPAFKRMPSKDDLQKGEEIKVSTEFIIPVKIVGSVIE